MNMKKVTLSQTINALAVVAGICGTTLSKALDLEAAKQFEVVGIYDTYTTTPGQYDPNTGRTESTETLVPRKVDAVWFTPDNELAFRIKPDGGVRTKIFGADVQKTSVLEDSTQRKYGAMAIRLADYGVLKRINIRNTGYDYEAGKPVWLSESEISSYVLKSGAGIPPSWLVDGSTFEGAIRNVYEDRYGAVLDQVLGKRTESNDKRPLSLETLIMIEKMAQKEKLKSEQVVAQDPNATVPEPEGLASTEQGLVKEFDH